MTPPPVIARSDNDEAISYPAEIAAPSARNDNRKGRNDTRLYVIARHVSAEAISKLNPKLKALNSEQIPI